MGGGGSNTNTVQSSDPWKGVQPYLAQMYGQGANLFSNGGPGVYPNNETAPFNPQQAQSLGQLGQLSNGQNVSNLLPLQQQGQATSSALAGGNTTGQWGLSNIINGNGVSGQLSNLAYGGGAGNSTLATLANGGGTANGILGALANGGGAGNNVLGALANGSAGGTGVLGALANGQGLGNNILGAIANGGGAGQGALGTIMNGSNAGMQALGGVANGSNAATQYLQGMLKPGYTDVASNPNLQAAMNAANYNTNFNFTNDVMPSLASQFSAAGRFGSGAQTQGINQATNNLATQISNTNSGLANQDYMQMLNNQANAAGTLGGLQSGAGQAYSSLAGNAANQYNANQAGAANQYNANQGNAANLLSGIQGNAASQLNNNQANSANMLGSNQANAAQNLNMSMLNAGNSLIGNQLQAGGALTNSQISGANMLPGMASLNANNAQLGLNAGTFTQQQAQTDLTNLVNQFNQQQQLPYNTTNWFAQLLAGGNPFGSSSSSGSQQQAANPYSTALGGALLGNSLIPGGYAGLLGGGAASTAGAFGTPLFTAAVGGAADAGASLMPATLGGMGMMAMAA